jgi:hypothetical protein
MPGIGTHYDPRSFTANAALDFMLTAAGYDEEDDLQQAISVSLQETEIENAAVDTKPQAGCVSGSNLTDDEQAIEELRFDLDFIGDEEVLHESLSKQFAEEQVIHEVLRE